MNDIKKCIDLCLECHRVCLQTSVYCLTKSSEMEMSRHIRLMVGCAELCRLHADFMIMGFEFHPKVGEICTQICDRCADECEKMDGDEKMRLCAETCRHGAESCRNTAGLSHAHAKTFEEPCRTPGSAEGER